MTIYPCRVEQWNGRTKCHVRTSSHNLHSLSIAKYLELKFEKICKKISLGFALMNFLNTCIVFNFFTSLLVVSLQIQSQGGKNPKVKACLRIWQKKINSSSILLL